MTAAVRFVCVLKKVSLGAHTAPSPFFSSSCSKPAFIWFCLLYRPPQSRKGAPSLSLPPPSKLKRKQLLLQHDYCWRLHDIDNTEPPPALLCPPPSLSNARRKQTDQQKKTHNCFTYPPGQKRTHKQRAPQHPLSPQPLRLPAAPRRPGVHYRPALAALRDRDVRLARDDDGAGAGPLVEVHRPQGVAGLAAHFHNALIGLCM